jgi:hypothetical protein
MTEMGRKAALHYKQSRARRQSSAITSWAVIDPIAGSQ